MIDPVAAIRTYLASLSAITALTSTRIYAEMTNPPAGYTPSAGRALCFKVRPGSFVTNEDGLLSISVILTCWAAASSTERAEQRCWALWVAVVGALGGGATVRHCEVETTGETIYDPDTGWPYVFGTVRMALDNS